MVWDLEQLQGRSQHCFHRDHGSCLMIENNRWLYRAYAMPTRMHQMPEWNYWCSVMPGPQYSSFSACKRAWAGNSVPSFALVDQITSQMRTTPHKQTFYIAINASILSVFVLTLFLLSRDIDAPSSYLQIAILLWPSIASRSALNTVVLPFTFFSAGRTNVLVLNCACITLNVNASISSREFLANKSWVST